MAQRNPFRETGGGSGGGSNDDDESTDETEEPDTSGQTSPVAGRTPPNDSTGTDNPTEGQSDEARSARERLRSDEHYTGGDSQSDSESEPDTVTGDPLPDSSDGIDSGSDDQMPDPGSSPSPSAGETPPSERPDDPPGDSEPDIDPGSSPSPPGGVAPPSERPNEPEPEPEPPEPDGINSERATDLRQDVAGQSDLFTERDVTVERTDEGLRGYVPEQVQRQVLRTEAASQTDVYGPSDISIRETNDGLEAFVSDETEREQIQEDTAEELGIAEWRVNVEERQLDSSPPAGRAPPDTQYDVSIDTSGARTVGGETNQTFDESQEQLEDSLSDSNNVVNQDVGTSDFGQTTDTDYDPDDHPSGLADALINTDTAQSVSSRGSVISGSIVTGLQDAGAFVAEGQGADEAGIAGDVVGGGLEGRAEGLGEFVTQPIEGTQAGGAIESGITGALGTAPGAIAQAPGDVALVARRGEQAGRAVASDPGSAGDVAATAAGYGVAGASSSASAVAAAPIREGVAIGALFVASGGAAQGARATAQRARSADVSVPDNVGRLARDERAAGQVPRSRRTRQVDGPDEPMTIEGGDLQDPSQMGRHVPEQRYGEYELGPSQPTRLEGMTERMGGRTTGPRSRTRRAQERQVRVGDPDLPGAVGAGAGVASADVVSQELGALNRAQQRQVQLEMERSATGIDSTTTTDTDVGQRIGIVPRQGTDQRSATMTTTIPQSTTDVPGRGGTPNRNTPRTPRLPRLPDMPESDETFGMGDTFDEEFGDIDVGSYIDPV